MAEPAPAPEEPSAEAPAKKYFNQDAAAKLGLGIVLFAAWMTPTGKPASWRLDDSYKQAYGFFLKEGLQAGRDYIFHLGPLGYFYSPRFDGDLYWIDLASRGALYAASIAILLSFLFRVPGILERALYTALLLFGVPFSTFIHGTSPNDAMYLLAALAAGLWMIERPEGHWARPAAGAAMLAVLALMKFTFLMLAGVCVGAAFIAALAARRPARAFGIAGGFAALFLAGWIAAGQSPVNLPAYISTSLEISRGYNEAMMVGSNEASVAWAIAAFACAAAALAISLSMEARSPGRWIATGVLTAGLFLGWKAGMLRQLSHSHASFVFAPLLPMLAARPAGAPKRNGAIGAAALLAFLAAWRGFFPDVAPYYIWPNNFLEDWSKNFSRNVWAIRKPGLHHDVMEEERKKLADEFAMPRTREAVGSEPIDLFSSSQGILFLNGLNWRPRPVFHSNAAYTPPLIEMNATHYRGADAPPWVLFLLEPIDDRFPALEDSETLPILFQRYDPVLIERDRVLMKRAHGGTTDSLAGSGGEIIAEREIGFDERVEPEAATGGEAVMLALDVRMNALGKLRGFLFKPPTVYLEIEASDGGGRAYRMPIGMAQKEFILNPFLRSQKEFIDLVQGAALPQVTGFRVHVQENQRKFFETKIGMKMARRDGAIRAGMKPGMKPPMDADARR